MTVVEREKTGTTQAEAEPAETLPVEIRGRVSHRAAEYARSKISALLGQVREPVLYVRVKLARMTNPALERPIAASAAVDLNGRLVCAHVAGKNPYEAVDLLRDRLAARLAHRDDTHRKHRHGAADRHTEPAAPEPDERVVVPHTSCAAGWESPDEAVDEMDTMGFEFHLFTDAGSGEDSVVYRDIDGYHLAQLHPRPEAIGPVAQPMTLGATPAPCLTLTEAEAQLDLSGATFVFFEDAATGRGHLLYRRCDGNYGLVVPNR